MISSHDHGFFGTGVSWGASFSSTPRMRIIPVAALLPCEGDCMTEDDGNGAVCWTGEGVTDEDGSGDDCWTGEGFLACS